MKITRTRNEVDRTTTFLIEITDKDLLEASDPSLVGLLEDFARTDLPSKPLSREDFLAAAEALALLQTELEDDSPVDRAKRGDRSKAVPFGEGR